MGYCYNKKCRLFNTKNNSEKLDRIDTKLYSECNRCAFIKPQIENEMDIQAGICLNCANIISEDLNRISLNEFKCNHCNSNDFIIIDLNVMNTKNTKNWMRDSSPGYAHR